MSTPQPAMGVNTVLTHDANNQAMEICSRSMELIDKGVNESDNPKAVPRCRSEAYKMQPKSTHQPL